MFASLRHYDPREIATVTHRVQSGMDAVIASRDPRHFVRDLGKIAGDPTAREHLARFLGELRRHAKATAARDRRYSLVLQLIREAETAVPGITAIAFIDWDPITHLRRLHEPVDLMVEANETTGEIRARAVVRAIREIVELLYHPYLRILWRLTYFAKKEWPKLPSDFGSLVHQAAERLKRLPGIVEARASHVRNAAAHAQWVYLPAEDAILMWDGRPGAPPVWQNKFRVEDLGEIAMDMYRLSGETLRDVYTLHAIRDFAGGRMIGASLDALAALERGDEETANRVCEETFEAPHEALREFIREKGPGTPPGTW